MNEDITDVGTVNPASCSQVGIPSGIQIVVAEAYDDLTPRQNVLLTCHGFTTGIQYRLDVDRAEALGLLLVAAAKRVRAMTKICEGFLD